MRSGGVRIFNGKQRKSLYLISHTLQLFKVKRSKAKVTRSRDVLADKDAITLQCIVITTCVVETQLKLFTHIRVDVIGQF